MQAYRLSQVSLHPQLHQPNILHLERQAATGGNVHQQIKSSPHHVDICVIIDKPIKKLIFQMHIQRITPLAKTNNGEHMKVSPHHVDICVIIDKLVKRLIFQMHIQRIIEDK